MKDGEDIVAVSLPFVAGVGAAAALKASPFAGGACLLAAAGCMVWMVLRKGRGAVLSAILFLMLGAFTWSASEGMALSDVKPPGGTAALPQKALRKLSSVIAEIPFQHSGTNALLRALLTGQRDLLDRGTVKSFRAAGASHILALSGLHLGIIYLILSKLLSFLGNSRRAWIGKSALIILCSGFYTLMTGAGPSIVRAFIFISLNEIARNCPGRRKTPMGIWCTALLLQLCFRPGIISSPGFQLSYLAMLGIFLLFPVLKDWYPSAGRGRDRWDPMHRMWESMALAISCQTFTAPVAWMHFHSFPKYFLLSNLISLPLTEGLIVGGLASIAAQAVKTSPRFLTRAVDWIAETLRQSLEVIATM